MATRDLILRLMPARWRAAAEAESRQWHTECAACGHASTIWDMGGLRWKAKAEVDKAMLCPACGRLGAHRLKKA